MLGHLLEAKTSRITQRKIKPFTQSNDNKKFDKKEGGEFVEFKMFGKLNKVFTYSKLIYLLNIYSYKQNPKEFAKNFKDINNFVNINKEVILMNFLYSLDLNQEKLDFLQNNKITPGIALRETSPFDLFKIKIPFYFNCGVYPKKP